VCVKSDVWSVKMTERLTYENVCNKFGEFLKSVHNDSNKDCTTLVNDVWLTSSLFSDTVGDGDGDGDELDTEVVLMELFTNYLTARQIMWDRGIVHLIIQEAFKNSHYGVTATVLDVANGVKQRYEEERNAYSEFEDEA
jgi:hypothetical protein